MKYILITIGTYQVQTNFFVQTVQTSIWVIASISKGVRGGVGVGISKSMIRGGRLIVKLSNPPLPFEVVKYILVSCNWCKISLKYMQVGSIFIRLVV